MSVFAALIEEDIIKAPETKKTIQLPKILPKTNYKKEKSRAITCPKCGANGFNEKLDVYKCCYCDSSWFKEC
jgi:4-hydroxy-3-methylbut-2-en-1-yl diphosphate synthase IspG/GcpE